jgi:hypothetical protein
MPYNLLEHPLPTSANSSQDFSSTGHSYSTPEFDSSESTASSDESLNTSGDDDIWDLVDSTYTRRVTLEDDDGKPISSALVIELDGATFGVDPSTNRVPLNFPLPPGGEDDIPHFPPLTRALFDAQGKLSKGFRLDGGDNVVKGKQAVFRTSGESG